MMIDIPDLPYPASPAAAALVGLALLFLGRRLYWLAVGVVGFLAGLTLTAHLIREAPPWAELLAGLVVGVAGALLAVFLQKVAVGMAGFLAGGFGALELARLAELQTGGWEWLLYFLGGILAAFLAVALFEWALIVLTALLGAAFLVHAAALGGAVALLAFTLLLLLGLAVQASLHLRRPRRRRAARED